MSIVMLILPLTVLRRIILAIATDMNIVELSCLFCYKHPQMLDNVTREVHMDDSNATTDINTPKNRYQDKIPCKWDISFL